MKILIIPSSSVYWNPSRIEFLLREAISKISSVIFPNLFAELKKPKKYREGNFLDIARVRHHNNPRPSIDLAWWGALNQISGVDPYILEKVNPAYFSKDPSGDVYDRWPVYFNFKPFRSMSARLALKEIKEFDWVLVSSRAPEKFSKIVDKALECNVKCAQIDPFDDDFIFDSDVREISPADEFTVLFKKEIPLYLNSKNTFPISPIPANVNRISHNLPKFDDKKYPIFFTGNYREQVIRLDRKIICDLFSDYYNLSKIFINQEKLSAREYNEYFRYSFIHLSPSGRVWDSFRHCESMAQGAVILLPKSDCKLTWDIFRDMDNCILYDAEKIINSDTREVEFLSIIKKIEGVMGSKDIYNRIASNARASISNTANTIGASKYIRDVLSES